MIRKMKKKKLSCHVSEISFARRMFLKDAGIAAVGIGLTGCMSMNTPAVRNDGGDDDISVTVMIEGSDDPFMRRILTILADRIQRRCQSHVVEVDNNAQLILAVDVTHFVLLTPVHPFVSAAAHQEACFMASVSFSVPVVMTATSCRRPGGEHLFLRVMCAVCISRRISITGIIRRPRRKLHDIWKTLRFGA